MLSFVYQTVQLALLLYMLLLFGRLALDWIQVFAREWRPSGLLLVIANVIYSLTDPPLRFLRRWIKPLPLGGMQLDLSFLVLVLGISLTRAIVLPIVFGFLASLL
ncbi:YggT family protein [Bogoriella caseilytica]|uniref:YggT family protein n=1 Tax=Bogoriella caseilytica TaxID=56055 RepID=A0A3N2B9Q9_9MICO|nr:YggT family protein [Bogoriella caseilytica]ROR71834.1 YggT family protein [Bogoriella caseilytica]